ncbi:MAG: hypothetical protein ABW202_05470 [Duganella sp.]
MRYALLIRSTLLAGAMTALPAMAQSSMGRLFHTPAERQTLDASRGKAVGANPAAAVTADDQAPPAMPMGRPATMTAEDMGGGPPPGQPGYQAGNAAAYPPGMPPAMTAPQEAATPPSPEQLQLNGVLRTSSGRSTVWLNNVPQSGAANKFSNRNSKALTVTLPSGRRIVLQPGQRYDLAEGRVKDINEP